MGAGSDHASFIFYAGVPVMDIMFLEDSHRYPDMSGYPAYHTGFEEFDLVDLVLVLRDLGIWNLVIL